MPPPPLLFVRCLPHTSWLGFFAAVTANVFPCLGEILYIFYAYNTTTYIDQQTVVPSFWFRWWRPGFLIAGILYDVGMLAYSIYMEDVFTVLLVVRVTMGLYQIIDHLWLVKRWVPFFVQNEKRRFFLVRLYVIGSIWFLVIGSTSWTGSWHERNDIFASIYYISLFVILFGCGLFFLVHGGVDFLVKYRFHWARNIFGVAALSGFMLGIVGLIIGDGGGNNLVETTNYHSVFILIYFVFESVIAGIIHRFIVVFEELSWKYPNPISSQSTRSRDGSMTLFEATNGLASASNKVVCDVDMPPSPIEGARTGSIPNDTVVIVAPPENQAEGTKGDTKPSTADAGLVEQGGIEEKDLESAHGLVSQSATVSVGDEPSEISPPINASLTREGSIDSSYKGQRRLALAFDGITRRSSILRSSILSHHIMTVKLKRHELVCREADKLFCVLYQMVVWEVVIWLAQIFLALYLRSVNTPTLPEQDGYYCQTPIGNTANSVQFVNDFVFARR